MKVSKAVIPAAGLGTRFLPATKAQPKEMLPVVDKPAIQYVVEEAVRAGITDILIITGRNKRSIEDHFDRNFELEHFLEQKGKFDELKQVRALSEMADIHYVRQGEPLGLGHAVALAEPARGRRALRRAAGRRLIIASDAAAPRDAARATSSTAGASSARSEVRARRDRLLRLHRRPSSSTTTSRGS